MKRLVTPFALLLLVAFAGPASAEQRRSSLRPVANPGAVIARELEFAQAARNKGQWTAFREFAAQDAVMFVPQMVRAQDWLKDRPDPAVAVRWQVHQVWSSCDGSLAVSTGAWQGQDRIGRFTTIWQRQDDGRYKWVYDHGETLAEPTPVPEMIPARVADCPDRGARRARDKDRTAPTVFDPLHRAGRSDDGTLRWTVTAGAVGGHALSVEWTKDEEVRSLLAEQEDAK